MEDYEKKQNNRLKQSKIILIVGILLLVISPYVLTRTFGIISFDQTGQIGDTIGGITSPIANLIGAILVYYAFLVQLDANKLIFEQISDEKKEQKINQNRNYIFEIFKLLKEEIYSFSIMKEKQVGSFENKRYVMVEYKGLQAIDIMLSKLMHNHEDFNHEDHKLKEFLHIIDLFKKFLRSLNETEINFADKKFFLESVEYMYSSKIKSSLEVLTKPCEKCGEFHSGDPKKLIALNDEIESSITKIKNSYA
ncbi:hypothetical protein FLJC2902T_31930 [Flavobacterium limnosediminis JC2902]|uniref:Phage abortive infection protein n=1 Tax=Flavobacterium limnosediminis JC2902 TaxID=1341181 RepID=V6SDM9_9FLAO|nr:hypothetical protein [Flavobacterium limnosediminis]ESU24661.1 hypothetical protein FLJC2902T_31930 [Flavobacterium limnosediminis JC2902]